MKRQKRAELIRAVVAQVGLPGRWAVADEPGTSAFYVLIAEAGADRLADLRAALVARGLSVAGTAAAGGEEDAGPAVLIAGTAFTGEERRRAALTNARLAARAVLGPADGTHDDGAEPGPE